MIRARRVTRSRPDPAILLLDQFRVVQAFFTTVTPFITNSLVQALRKGFSEAIGKGLRHDCVVVVVLAPKLVAQFLQANSARHGKGADMVWQAGFLRRDEVGE